MALALTTAPGSVNLAKNPVYVKFLSTSHTGLDNYRVVLRVQFEDDYASGTFAEVMKTEAIPDSNGETCFDLSDILQAEMERTMTFQVPDFANPIPYVADILRNFKIQYLEKYGTPQVEQSATTSSAYKVLYGGVDAHYFGLYDFFSNLSTTNGLLTYFPTGKFIGRDQPEYITYIQHLSAASNYNAPFIRVIEYDDEGNVLSTFDKYRIAVGYPDPISLERYQAGVFPVGATELGIDADAVKYSVQVFAIQTLETMGGEIESGSPTQASQVYTFYIDDNLKSEQHDIIWFGGFNNPHILRCTGRKRTRLAVDRMMSEQVVPFGYDPTTMAMVQHRRNYSQPYTYRSGELTPEQKDALQELLIENKILEYNIDGNYYRLALTENSFDIYEERQSPNYLEFNAVRSLSARNYMRLRSIADGAPTEQQWLLNDNGFWELNDGGYWQLN